MDRCHEQVSVLCNLTMDGRGFPEAEAETLRRDKGGRRGRYGSVVKALPGIENAQTQHNDSSTDSSKRTSSNHH